MCCLVLQEEDYRDIEVAETWAVEAEKKKLFY